MNKISEQILSAIDIVADEKLSRLQFDRTVQGEIYKLEDADGGEYQVRYQGNIFTAYSEDLETIYKTGDVVFIKVPEGDFSNRKLITGLVSGSSLTDIQLTELANTIVEVSPTFDSFYAYLEGNANSEDNPNENVYGVVAGAGVDEPNSEAYIYGPVAKHPNDPDGRDTSNDRFQQYANNYKYIKLEASFLTVFHEPHTKGNYGIEIEFFTKDPSTNVRYILDNSAFNGDPYALGTYSPQYIVVEAQTNYLLGVRSIRLFERDFEYDHRSYYNQEEDSYESQAVTTPNIFCKDVKIQYVDKRDLTDTTYYLTISPIDGDCFTDNVSTLTLQGRLIYQGDDVLDSKRAVCTWFERDLSVLPGTVEYDKDAGFGWKRLEASSTVAIDGGRLTLTNSDEIVHEQKYKLKVEYGDKATSTAEIEIFNLQSKYNYSYHLSQVTTNENIELQLIDDRETEPQIKGRWYMSYPDGTFMKFSDGALGYTEDELYSRIEIKDKLLYSAVTFYCSVYESGKYLGTLEHTVWNSESQEDLIVSYEGEDNFKYDANGDVTIEDSEKDRTLTVHLAWKEGIGTSYSIQWLMRIPSTGGERELPTTFETRFDPESSMLEAVWLDTDANLLHYHIKQKYRTNFTNNSLIIKITTLDEKVYTFEKEILFLKDGDQGTNGTTYVIAVRPIDPNSGSDMVKLTSFQGLRYQNGVWSNPVTLGCYVYKDGEKITHDRTGRGYSINFKWEAINVFVDGRDQISEDGRDKVVVRGANSSDTAHYVKVQVTIKDRLNGRENIVYSYYPIDVMVGSIDQSKVNIDTIPSYIKYTSTGIIPMTQSNNITFTYGGEDCTKNISSLNTSVLAIEDKDGNRYLKPATSFIFEDATTGIGVLKCATNSSGLYVIHSIVMYLDTYGNEAINGWDGTKVEIEEGGDGKSGYLLAPQVGAGEKDPATNLFTGVVMGKDSGATNEKNQKGQIGLFGYKSGVNTFGLKDDGTAYFGAFNGGGRIVLDGRYAMIYGGDASVNRNGTVTRAENGMILVLADHTEGKGTGSGVVGNQRATASSTAIAVGLVTTLPDKGLTSADGAITYKNEKYGNFEVDYSGRVFAQSATINGRLYAEAGKIGGSSSKSDDVGWTIEENKISSSAKSGHVELNSGSVRPPIVYVADQKTGKLNKTGFEESTVEGKENWGYGRIWAGDTSIDKAPFFVTSTGYLYAKNAFIDGKINSVSGQIGGWTLDGNSIYSYYAQLATVDGKEMEGAKINVVLRADNTKEASKIADINTSNTTTPNKGFYRFWAGNEDPNKAAFGVSSNGWLRANNASIQGTIFAAAGRIGSSADGKQTGGWIIDKNYIKSVPAGSTRTDIVALYNPSAVNGSEGEEGKKTDEGQVTFSRPYSSAKTFASGAPTTTGYARIWAGGATPGTAKFYVTREGYLHATEADITGKISAGTGEIGGWEIYATSLRRENTSSIVGMGIGTAVPLASDHKDDTYIDADGKTKKYTYSALTFWAAPKDAVLETKSVLEKRSDDGTEVTVTKEYIYLRTGAGNKPLYHKNTKDSTLTRYFFVTSNGTLYCANAMVDGEIHAKSGFIGSTGTLGDQGWKISEGAIEGERTSEVTTDKGKSNVTHYVTLSTTGNYAFWAGATATTSRAQTSATSAPFSVQFDGTIKATKGQIAGWTITENKLETTGKEKDGKTTIKSTRIYLDGSASISTDASGKDSSGNVIYVQGKVNNDNNPASDAAGDDTRKSSTTGLFYVTASGRVYAENAEIKGKLESDEGQIGGWTISKNYLASGALSTTADKSTVGMASRGVGNTDANNLAFWVGKASPTTSTDGEGAAISADDVEKEIESDTTADTTTSDSYFYVTRSGKLYCKSATIAGKIIAKSGKIGGWTIDATKLSFDGENNTKAYLNGSTGEIQFGDYFSVTPAGKLTAKSGEIGGWYIREGSLMNSETATDNDNTESIGSGPDQTDCVRLSTSGLRWGTKFQVNSSGLTVKGTIKCDELYIGGKQVTSGSAGSKVLTLGTTTTDATTKKKSGSSLIFNESDSTATIVADEVVADWVYAGTVKADQVEAGTLTGMTVLFGDSRASGYIGHAIGSTGKESTDTIAIGATDETNNFTGGYIQLGYTNGGSIALHGGTTVHGILSVQDKLDVASTATVKFSCSGDKITIGSSEVTLEKYVTDKAVARFG